jgi:hypothetical protein
VTTYEESSIPPEAREFLDRVDQAGDHVYQCVVDERTVGYRHRDDAGALIWEIAIKDGLKHGIERQWEPDGTLTFETTYVDGLEHGVARQWDRDGRLLGTYRMEHGTGVDLWRNGDGTLSEERYLKDGYLHGLERWWNWDDRTVWNEGHFKWGEKHGVFREWNHQGGLRRGYPQYFVDGARARKRQYLKACAKDDSLPPFREEDNRPERPLPPELLDQR